MKIDERDHEGDGCGGRYCGDLGFVRNDIDRPVGVDVVELCGCREGPVTGGGVSGSREGPATGGVSGSRDGPAVGTELILTLGLRGPNAGEVGLLYGVNGPTPAVGIPNSFRTMNGRLSD